MDAIWFRFFILLLLITLFAWPTWPCTRERWVYRRPGRWRYAPSGTAAALALLILPMFRFGIIAIAWPWCVAPPPPPPN